MIPMYEMFIDESWSATPAMGTVLGNFAAPQEIFNKTLDNRNWYKDSDVDIKDVKDMRSEK